MPIPQPPAVHVRCNSCCDSSFDAGRDTTRERPDLTSRAARACGIPPNLSPCVSDRQWFEASSSALERQNGLSYAFRFDIGFSEIALFEDRDVRSDAPNLVGTTAFTLKNH